MGESAAFLPLLVSVGHEEGQKRVELVASVRVWI